MICKPVEARRPSLGGQSSTSPAFSGTWPTTHPDTGYTIPFTLLGQPRKSDNPFRIVLAGAGASAIDFLHFAEKELVEALGCEISVYEKNHDIGGTWLENRYPGCACDIPSVSYQFPWRPKPDWGHFYSYSPEIWQYMKDVVNEEGMMKYITLLTEVKKAVWREDESKWVLNLVRKDQEGNVVEEREEWCDYFVNTTGFLNAWKWPDIDGLHSFKGLLAHTARYPEGTDLKGKRVAVVGSGSSGIQVVASVQKEVSELHTWVRSPTWITAGFAQQYAGENGANFAYTDEQKQLWSNDPDAYLKHRKDVEGELNQRFKFILSDTQESAAAKEFSTKEMSTKLSHDKRLVETIIPKDFDVGCRRPTPGQGYLEALVAPNTTVYTESIDRITPRGFIPYKGADEVEVDVIILATGFDTTFRPRFPIIGLDGCDIRSIWANHPLSYLSLGVPRVPNYFIYIGSYGPLGHGAALPIIETLTKYLIQTITKMRREHIRRLAPSEQATREFGEHAQLFLQRTAWTGPCRSWFKQGTRDGPVVMWPGSRLHFFDALLGKKRKGQPRWEDYDISYWAGNRFGYFGNGFTTDEFDGSDITYYLR